MRSVNFRDNVLWAVAEKDGYDPTVDLLDDLAREYVSSINAWVRRLYDVADQPEWTEIQPFTPNPSTHLVSWDAVPGAGGLGDSANSLKIGKPLHVYLIDPRTTWAPVDTPFRETSSGIYVGFDHGATVWIKYIPRAPVFTSEKWNSARTYKKDEITYSPTTGECYKSKANGNRGHDPAAEVARDITTEITQDFILGDTGLTPQDKIIEVSTKRYLALVTTEGLIPDPPPNASSFWINVNDSAGVILANVSQAPSGGASLATITTNLANALIAAPGLAGFTITADTVNFKIRIQHDSDFYFGNIITGTDAPHYYASTNSNAVILRTYEVQPLITASVGATSPSQQIQIQIGSTEVQPSALYNVTIIDSEGVEHTVQYEALQSDGANQILAGISAAMDASSDTFFDNVLKSLDATSNTLTITTIGAASVNAEVAPPGSAWWALVPFPLALVNEVVRGVYADALKTEGQADKGDAEEQRVPQETQLRMNAALATGVDTLTDQENTRGRYAR